MKKLTRYLKNPIYHIHRGFTTYLTSRKLGHSLKYVQNSLGPIHCVYDIGARHGAWSQSIKKILPSANFFLFEANEKCKVALAETGFPFFIAALSSASELVDFYSNDSTGDSFFKENTKYYSDVAPVKLQTQSLDDFVESEKIPQPDFIKLDTQGAELEILKGGSICLKKASLIYMECPIIKYNEGAPNIQEYLSFMQEADFVPLDICEIHRSHDVLMQIDILFIRRSKLFQISPLANDVFRF